MGANNLERVKELIKLFFSMDKIDSSSIEYLAHKLNANGDALTVFNTTYGGLLPYSGGLVEFISVRNSLLVTNFSEIQSVEYHTNLPPFFKKWTDEMAGNKFEARELDALWMLWILTMTQSNVDDLKFISSRFAHGFEFFYEAAKYFNVQDNYTGLLMLASNCYAVSPIVLADRIRPRLGVHKQPHQVINLNVMDIAEVYNVVGAFNTTSPIFVIASNTLLETNPSIKKIVYSLNRPNITLYVSGSMATEFTIGIGINELRRATFEKMPGYLDAKAGFESCGFYMFSLIGTAIEGKETRVVKISPTSLPDAVSVFMIGSQFPMNKYAGYDLNEHVAYLNKSEEHTTAKFNRMLIGKK